MATKSSERSKQYLEAKGYLWGKTESYNTFTHQRKDLFNMCDGIAIKDGKAICIQACAGSGDVASHVKKLQENPIFPQVSAALPVYILTWAKRGPRGKRKVWTVKIFNLFSDSVVESSL
jgi:hypothetical protein